MERDEGRACGPAGLVRAERSKEVCSSVPGSLGLGHVVGGEGKDSYRHINQRNNWIESHFRVLIIPFFFFL